MKKITLIAALVFTVIFLQACETTLKLDQLEREHTELSAVIEAKAQELVLVAKSGDINQMKEVSAEVLKLINKAVSIDTKLIAVAEKEGISSEKYVKRREVEIAMLDLNTKTMECLDLVIAEKEAEFTQCNEEIAPLSNRLQALTAEYKAKYKAVKATGQFFFGNLFKKKPVDKTKIPIIAVPSKEDPTKLVVRGGCVPKWDCTEWDPECEGKVGDKSAYYGSASAHSFKIKRKCKDLNECGTDEGKPKTDAHCVFCTPKWECEQWSDCDSRAKQTRVCTDKNLCKKEDGKPDTERSCIISRTIETRGRWGSGASGGTYTIRFHSLGGNVKGTAGGSHRQGGYKSTLHGVYSGGEGGRIAGTLSGIAWINPTDRDPAGKQSSLQGQWSGTVSLMKGTISGRWTANAWGTERGSFSSSFSPPISNKKT